MSSSLSPERPSVIPPTLEAVRLLAHDILQRESVRIGGHYAGCERRHLGCFAAYVLEQTGEPVPEARGAAAWQRVQTAMYGAKAIATDGCHKIYVLLDDAQVQEFERAGYGQGGALLLAATEFGSTDDMVKTVQGWYAESCLFRFVSSVRTVDGDPNDGFTNLIAQFELEDDDE